jgi:nitrogen fixation NifU-like protein
LESQREETDFDRAVLEIQRQIIERERTLYSAKVIEAAHNPMHFGTMTEPDAYGIIHGWCGDTMEIYLRLDGDRIAEVTFTTDGCGPSVACGNTVATIVHGMSLAEAGGLRPEDLLEALDGLPEDSTHCAELAVSTLRAAIANSAGRSNPQD